MKPNSMTDYKVTALYAANIHVTDIEIGLPDMQCERGTFRGHTHTMEVWNGTELYNEIMHANDI